MPLFILFIFIATLYRKSCLQLIIDFNYYLYNLQVNSTKMLVRNKACLKHWPHYTSITVTL